MGGMTALSLGVMVVLSMGGMMALSVGGTMALIVLVIFYKYRLILWSILKNFANRFDKKLNKNLYLNDKFLELKYY